MSDTINNKFFTYIAHKNELSQELADKYKTSIIFIGDENQLYNPLTKTYVGIPYSSYLNLVSYTNNLGNDIDRIDYVTAAALNDLNYRITYNQSYLLSTYYNFVDQYDTDQQNIYEAINTAITNASTEWETSYNNLKTYTTTSIGSLWNTYYDGIQTSYNNLLSYTSSAYSYMLNSYTYTLNAYEYIKNKLTTYAASINTNATNITNLTNVVNNNYDEFNSAYAYFRSTYSYFTNKINDMSSYATSEVGQLWVAYNTLNETTSDLVIGYEWAKNAYNDYVDFLDEYDDTTYVIANALIDLDSRINTNEFNIETLTTRQSDLATSYNNLYNYTVSTLTENEIAYNNLYTYVQSSYAYILDAYSYLLDSYNFVLDKTLTNEQDLAEYEYVTAVALNDLNDKYRDNLDLINANHSYVTSAYSYLVNSYNNLHSYALDSYSYVLSYIKNVYTTLHDFALDQNSNYIPLTGNSIATSVTGPIIFNDTTGRDILRINSVDKNTYIWHLGGHSGEWDYQYGFGLQYLGTQSANNNALVLYSSNQNGTPVKVFNILQDGTTTVAKATTFQGQIKSTVANGTAPLTVASSTVITNLNADLLDGHHWSYFALDSSYQNLYTYITTSYGNLYSYVLGSYAYLVTLVNKNIDDIEEYAYVTTVSLINLNNRLSQLQYDFDEVDVEISNLYSYATTEIGSLWNTYNNVNIAYNNLYSYTLDAYTYVLNRIIDINNDYEEVTLVTAAALSDLDSRIIDNYVEYSDSYTYLNSKINDITSYAKYEISELWNAYGNIKAYVLASYNFTNSKLATYAASINTNTTNINNLTNVVNNNYAEFNSAYAYFKSTYSYFTNKINDMSSYATSEIGQLWVAYNTLNETTSDLVIGYEWAKNAYNDYVDFLDEYDDTTYVIANALIDLDSRINTNEFNIETLTTRQSDLATSYSNLYNYTVSTLSDIEVDYINLSTELDSCYTYLLNSYSYLLNGYSYVLNKLLSHEQDLAEYEYVTAVALNDLNDKYRDNLDLINTNNAYVTSAYSYLVNSYNDLRSYVLDSYSYILTYVRTSYSYLVNSYNDLHSYALTLANRIYDSTEDREQHTVLAAPLENDGPAYFRKLDWSDLPMGSIYEGEAFYKRLVGNGEVNISAGVASIKKIKGNTIEWNQLVQNGNFASTSNWTTNEATISVASNIATVVGDSANRSGIYQTISDIVTGNKYMLTAYFTGTTADGYGRYASAFMNNSTNCTTTNVDGNDILNAYDTSITTRRTLIFTGNSSFNKLTFKVRVGTSEETPTNIQVANAMLIDLTRIFGVGNEPTTYDEFIEAYQTIYASTGNKLNYFNYSAPHKVNFTATKLQVKKYNMISAGIRFTAGSGSFGNTNSSKLSWTRAANNTMLIMTRLDNGGYVAFYKSSMGGDSPPNYFTSKIKVTAASDSTGVIQFASYGGLVSSGIQLSDWVTFPYQWRKRPDGEWHILSMRTTTGFASRFDIRFEGDWKTNDEIQFDHPILIGLKLAFGIGNEPATYQAMDTIYNDLGRYYSSAEWDANNTLDEINLNITTLVGTPINGGASEILFPEGMKSVGDVYDELSKENGVWYAYRRIGTDENTGDYIVLPTEEVFILNSTFRNVYKVRKDCWEVIVPNSENTPTTSPAKLGICYGFDIMDIMQSIIGVSYNLDDTNLTIEDIYNILDEMQYVISASLVDLNNRILENKTDIDLLTHPIENNSDDNLKLAFVDPTIKTPIYVNNNVTINPSNGSLSALELNGTLDASDQWGTL